MSAPKDTWTNSEKPFCLCIGAGVTASIVGSWPELLRKLTATRYLTRWEQDAENDETMRKQGVRADELAKVLKKNPNLQLYPSTDVLEQGEYLLL